ncbi:MAG: penicillin-binding transpeptidase domain-containing protein [Eubacteriales bacterium]|nr:penicillin-binding transpeptidase domain-containing protein [Eubacteriales bacterium]
MGQNKNVKTKEERTPKKKKTRYGKRIAFLETALLLAFIIVIIDIFCIMVVLGPERLEVAVQQWTRTSTITANRGQIVDCNGKVLATTGAVYKILLWPKNITSGSEERVARELSDALDLDFDYVYKCATNKTRSEFVIKRQVDSKTVSNVRSLKLSGVGIANDSKRYYPYGTLLSQVIGFTTRDNVGQSGLELKYDKYLTGSDGKLISETDSSGNPLAYGYTQYEDPIDGAKIVLTVDQVFQSYLENALEEALSVNNASSAQGIILDVNTGAIKAISTKPDYDPNDPPRNDLEQLAELSRNRLVTDVYEPGSTFKILTLAAAIDSGNADLNSTFFCNGGYIVNSERIKCWKHAGHGSQDLTKATENSCNCCFMQLALRMGVSEFYDYLYAFGLGQKTGDIFDGESSGIVTNEKYVTENDLARIGFGQSVAVTPIQLAAAVSAAVNGGYLYSPYIVEQVVSSDGTVIEQADPSPVRQVISGETSATVRQILQSVVDNGTGRNAKIEGYYVGGKTGTAQKYDEYGRVSAGSYICSFIGFAPADDPQYLCLILVDEPHVGSIFGSTVAAPFVRRVLSETLPYSGIQPSHLSETVTVPNVLGLTTEEANKELAKVGLIGFFECADEVTLQLPAAGETVVKGSSVLLYTGSDDVNIDNEPVIAPLMVEMPDLIDMTAVQAYNALTALGLNMVCSPEDPHGVVLGQSIYAGTMVEYGSSVTLYFGIKPEE